MVFTFIRPVLSEESLPFSFDSLSNNKQVIEENYITWVHDLHKNTLFHFTVALQKGWKVLKTKEPTGISSMPVEFAAFHKFAEADNPKSQILAALYFYVVQVPDQQKTQRL